MKRNQESNDTLNKLFVIFYEKKSVSIKILLF